MPRSQFKKFQKFLLPVYAGLLSVVLGAGCGPATGSFADCVENDKCISSLEVRKYSGDIPLSPDSRFWNWDQGPQKLTVELGPQLITNPQWPNPSIKAVTLSAARTETEIAVRLEWDDSAADLEGPGAVHRPGYRDANRTANGIGRAKSNKSPGSG